MSGAWRYSTTDWITGGAQVFLIFVAVEIGTPAGWRFCLMALAVFSFAAWMAAWRRYRQIDDLPTSRVASAAQGYVELFGRAKMLDGTPVVSRLGARPCCWYRYIIERKDGDDRWQVVESGVSEAHFLLEDATGECVISPDGAEVVGMPVQRWTEGDYRHAESLLLPGSTLYALGELRTVGGAVAELDVRGDVNALLADWKQDRTTLLARYDANGDGEIDLQEWEKARLDAQSIVEEDHRQTRLQDGVHVLARPRDGRPFLIAREMPQKLGRRFARWSAVHFCVFVAAGVGGLMVR